MPKRICHADRVKSKEARKANGWLKEWRPYPGIITVWTVFRRGIMGIHRKKHNSMAYGDTVDRRKSPPATDALQSFQGQLAFSGGFAGIRKIGQFLNDRRQDDCLRVGNALAYRIEAINNGFIVIRQIQENVRVNRDFDWI
jgi:hypothetical protein